MKTLLAPVIAASSAALLLTSNASAQTTSVWDGGGANGLSTNATNWVGDVVPVPATNASLQFAGTNRLLITNGWDAGTGFDNILFASGAGAFNYTGASRFSVNGNITNSSTNLQTLSVQRANADQLGLNFLANKAHTINAASGDILVSGAVQFNTGASNVINKEGNFTLTMANPTTNAPYHWRMNVNAGTLVIGSIGSLGFASSHSTPANATNGFTVASGATLAVANLVTDAQITSMLGTGNFAAGSSLGFDTGLGTAAGNRIYSDDLTDTVSGSLGVQKRGTNMLVLSGSNTYSGNASILAGVLAAAGKSSLPGWDTVGRYSVASNAILAVGNEFSDADITTMLGTGNFNAAAGIGFYTEAGDRTYSANLTGARGLAKAGANALTISGTNSYTGATVINGGALKLGSALVSGALQMSGTGTLDLNGNTASFASSTALGGNIASSGTTITDNAAGTGTSMVTLSNFNNRPDDVRALITDGATREVGVTLVNNSYWYPQLRNSNNTYSGGTLVTGTAGFGSRLAFGVDNATNNYTPNTNVGGTLISSQIGTGAVTLGTNSTDKGQLMFQGSTSVDFYNDIVFNTALGADLAGGVRFVRAGMILKGTQTANLANASYVGNGGGSFTIEGKITGSFGLEMKNVGQALLLTLNSTPGANDYDGDTLIQRNVSLTDRSVLQLGADDQIPDGAGKGNVNAVGVLRMNGFNDTINGLNNVSGGVSSDPALSFVQNNSATNASTLTLGGGDANGSYTGTIQDGGTAALAIIKTGTGTQSFTGTNNTYTGTTDIQGGVLSVASTTSLPGYNSAAMVSISNGATIAVGNAFSDADITTLLANATFASGANLGFSTAAGDRTYSDEISGDIGVVKLDANTLVLSGSNSYTGGTRIDGGMLLAASSDSLPGYNSAGKVTIASGATVAVGNGFSDADVTTLLSNATFASGANLGFSTADGDRSYAGDISGNIGLVKLDANALTLSGTNSYTGRTAVGGGTLRLGGALPSGALNMTGTAILDLNGNNATFTSSAGSPNTAASGNTITDNAAGAGTSVVFFSNLANQDDKTMGALITDGTNRQVGVQIANANYFNALLTNTNNDYSGGTTFTAADSYGTRYIIQSYNPTLTGPTLTASELGTGAINVGTNATDNASVVIEVANKTFYNDFVWDGTGTDENRGQLVSGAGGTTTFNGTQTLNTDLRMSAFGAGPTTLVFNGKVTGNGGLTLAAPAAGWATTVTLQNTNESNDYAGLTSINRVNETLILGANNQIPDGSGKGNVNVVGTLRLNGFSDTINGLTGTNPTATVHNNNASNASTLTLGGGDATATFSGTITDGGAAALSLVKTGTGTQTLAGTNTHTGNTTVNNGQLVLATNGVLRFVIGGNGTNNALTGAGAAFLQGTFNFDLAGAATNAGSSWNVVSVTTPAYDGGFQVAGFTNSGGTWSVETNGVTYEFVQGTGVLSVAGGSDPYTAWLTNYPSLVGTNALPGADPEADGFINDEEFAFGGDPTVGSPALLVATKSGTNAVISFIADTNVFTYTVGATTNLATGPWTNAAVTVTNSTNTNGVLLPSYLRREFTVPASGRTFYRVTAEQN